MYELNVKNMGPDAKISRMLSYYNNLGVWYWSLNTLDGADWLGSIEATFTNLFQSSSNNEVSVSEIIKGLPDIRFDLSILNLDEYYVIPRSYSNDEGWGMMWSVFTINENDKIVERYTFHMSSDYGGKIPYFNSFNEVSNS